MVADTPSYDKVGKTLYRSHINTGNKPSPYAGILLLNPDCSFGSKYAPLWARYTVRWPDTEKINNKSTSLENQPYPIRLVGNPDQLKLTDESPERPYMLFLSPLNIGLINQPRFEGVDLLRGINRNYAKTEEKEALLNDTHEKAGNPEKTVPHSSFKTVASGLTVTLGGRGDFVVDLLLSQTFSSKEKLHKQNTKIRLRKH